MCGIFGIFNLEKDVDANKLRKHGLELSQKQRHRGPDATGVYQDDYVLLIHERLSVMDPLGGGQPLISEDGNLVLIANGEIYNHKELAKEFINHKDPIKSYKFLTHSDCEVINCLFNSLVNADYIPSDKKEDPKNSLRTNKFRTQTQKALISKLNGIYAFILWNKETEHLVIARDPMGVCPLYWGNDKNGRMYIASEMKAISEVCDDVSEFPPGYFYDNTSGLMPFYEKRWTSYDRSDVCSCQDCRKNFYEKDFEIRKSLEESVHRQLHADVPYGVLLSGGLDSSLIAYCASKFSKKKLNTFSVGLENSPDLKFADIVAEHIGSNHHKFIYTFQEGLDSLSEVIKHIESYDVTSIRASTPMFIMARKIKSLGFKMVLSGEGADEIFGGYLYFHKAPNAKEFHEETVRKLQALHSYDCLRANKSMMAWGVEVRVPFLDLVFLDTAMDVPAEKKMIIDGRIEKQILRDAFAGTIPDSVLYRQKEQFSDGVGYGWIDGLKDYASKEVSDEQLSIAHERFPYNTPETKEAYLYRDIFEKHFPSEACARTVPGGKSIACSTPTAIAWDASFAKMADPSGRTIQGIHEKALLST